MNLHRLGLAVGLIGSIAIVLGYYRTPNEHGVAPYATPGWEWHASEWTALTTALYWEGDLHESREGLRAIAWSVLNRVHSKDFPRDKSRPHNIRGIVSDGVKRGKRDQHGGCQYSFGCNGAGETPKDFQRLQGRMGVHLTLEQCKERWARYSQIAAEFLKDPGVDPTHGAKHYWALTMPQDPYWVAKDIVPGSIITIGSHKFGYSRFLGEDVPRKLALE